ncbi:MAG: SDR family oxidoreductase [Pseudomonadota bacterium]
MSIEKIALVTGSSRGIGAATARLLASQGYGICINYQANAQAALELQAEIQARGARAIAVQADVSQEEDVQRLFKAVDEQLGRITALVNNAGILATQMRVEDMDAARINRILTTNVTGYFLCSREAIRRMSPRHGGQGGAIVNVSSAASRIGSPGEYVDYAASKGAVDTLTTGLALELAADGIRVNGVRPGIIYTDIHASGGEPGRVDRVKQNIPMQRGGWPEEVAQAIAWLLSDASSYSTGAFIDVTGGR